MSERTTATVSFDEDQLRCVDDLVHDLKQRGIRRASRSAVIRAALHRYLQAFKSGAAETETDWAEEPPSAAHQP